jgi:hypothetical protein
MRHRLRTHSLNITVQGQLLLSPVCNSWPDISMEFIYITLLSISYVILIHVTYYEWENSSNTRPSIQSKPPSILPLGNAFFTRENKKLTCYILSWIWPFQCNSKLVLHWFSAFRIDIDCLCCIQECTLSSVYGVPYRQLSDTSILDQVQTRFRLCNDL